jgi:XTP/dITP diphosphohydrolase
MPYPTIIFATGNSHKVQEVNNLIGDDYDFKTLKEINWSTEIIEDGTSFHQNALIKAKTIYDAGNPIVVSEDSGIVVNALDGSPGIFSARWAEMHDTSLDNNGLLLEQMQGQTDRSAYFVAVVCLVIKGEVKFFEGKWEGQLASVVDGTTGFGYDPIFIPNGYDKSTASLGQSIKQKESHRTQAFLQFKTYWESIY